MLLHDSPITGIPADFGLLVGVTAAGLGLRVRSGTFWRIWPNIGYVELVLYDLWGEEED